MALACPTCDGDLAHITKYDRWYCEAERKYAPKGYGGGKNLTCPECNQTLSHIEQYDRYYCHKESKYMPPQFGKETATEEPGADEPETDRESEPDTITAAEEPSPSTPATEISAEVETSEQRQPEEPASVERIPPDRSRILKAKKSVLIDLSREFGLNPRGTKEVLRRRLLRFLKDQRTGRTEEDETPAREDTSAVPPETDAPFPEVPYEPVAETPTEEEPTVAEAAIFPGAGTQPSEPPPAENPCSHCGGELVFIERYARFWCPKGREYAPPLVKLEDVPPPVIEHPCPTCGAEMVHIAQFDRWYCYREGRYAPVETPPYTKDLPRPTATPARYEAAPAPRLPPPPRPPEVASPASHTPQVATVAREDHRCPTCGNRLTHVKRYDRWFCFSCETYPEATPKNPCPRCGKELALITKYNRWYCYAEDAYAPADYSSDAAIPRLPTEAPTANTDVVRRARVVRAGAIHKHGRPETVIALASFGLLTFVLVQGLVFLPRLLSGSAILSIPVAMEASLDFLWKLFFGLAIVVGALGLRTRK